MKRTTLVVEPHLLKLPSSVVNMRCNGRCDTRLLAIYWIVYLQSPHSATFSQALAHSHVFQTPQSEAIAKTLRPVGTLPPRFRICCILFPRGTSAHLGLQSSTYHFPHKTFAPFYATAPAIGELLCLSFLRVHARGISHEASLMTALRGTKAKVLQPPSWSQLRA